ncbi:MAG: SDR family NAD(P)-dependent oxidoreductase [Crocinitomicaceae bacterium]|jgi:NAD(P)-dependent dehydrogenase (short-subunit alcohol dehydrogenase family)|tara:strand:- start:15080 stop:15883 length:804 start_codon:yes stop_codon:yes gene_type:complete
MNGKVAIITGSSRGIGKGIAKELLEAGAKVILNGRDETRLKKAKADLMEVSNCVDYYCCDVTNSIDSKKLVDFAIKQYGRLDILINNVGVSSRGNVSDCEPLVFENVMKSNFIGSVIPTIYALKYLRETQGSVVFISSVAGIRGLPGLAPYCASKMALRSLAESIRIEEYKSKIHVGLIYVGITEIEHNKESISADGSPIVLDDRSGKKAQSIAYVAGKVLRNIKKRKFITTLSTVGVLNAFLQPRFPYLVERLIIRASSKFKERSK